MAKATTKPTTEENWRIQDLNTWPGAFGIYKYSKQAIKLNINSFIILFVLNIGVVGVTNSFGLIPDYGSSVADLISVILNVFLSIATVIVLLDSIRGEKSDWLVALKKSTQYFINYFVTSILVSLILIGSLLALVIPFFFIAPRMVNVFYHLIDKDMEIIDSIKASWESTSNNVGKIYGIFGVNILIVLLAVTIIGLPFAIWFGIMYYAASAIYYEYTTKAAPVALKAPKTKKVAKKK